MDILAHRLSLVIIMITLSCDNKYSGTQDYCPEKHGKQMNNLKVSHSLSPVVSGGFAPPWCQLVLMSGRRYTLELPAAALCFWSGNGGRGILPITPPQWSKPRTFSNRKQDSGQRSRPLRGDKHIWHSFCQDVVARVARQCSCACPAHLLEQIHLRLLAYGWCSAICPKRRWKSILR